MEGRHLVDWGFLRSLPEFFDSFRDRWMSPWGLVLGVLLVAFSALGLLSFWIGSSIAQKVVAASAGLAVFGAWAWGWRLPRVPRGQVGVVISIATENSTQAKRLRMDFVNEVARGCGGKHLIRVIALREHHAKNVTDLKRAWAVMKRMHAHFIVYGRYRLRGGVHRVDIDGVCVVHSKTDNAVSERLGKEIGQIIPKPLVRISDERQDIEFELKAAWLQIAARYIIGIAAYLSLDFDYAKGVFESLRGEVESGSDLEICRKLRGRIPQRLREVYYYSAVRNYRLYRQTRRTEYLEAFGKDMASLEEICKEQFPAYDLKAIYLFLGKRDIDGARKAIELGKGLNKQDPGWKYSEAFLLAYEGKFSRAATRYEKALKKKYQEVQDVVSFIEEVADEEPGAIGLQLALGMIELRLGQLEDARKHFEAFHSGCNDEKAFALAQRYLTELDALAQVAAGRGTGRSVSKKRK